MFSTSLRSGKAFAAAQKIRELKTRIAKLASQKSKISPNKIIEVSASKMNIQPTKKYKLAPEEIEQKALQSERFRALYNMFRLEKTNKINQRQDRYDKKIRQRKPFYWRESICFSWKNKEKKFKNNQCKK